MLRTHTGLCCAGFNPKSSIAQQQAAKVQHALETELAKERARTKRERTANAEAQRKLEQERERTKRERELAQKQTQRANAEAAHAAKLALLLEQQQSALDETAERGRLREAAVQREERAAADSAVLTPRALREMLRKARRERKEREKERERERH